MTEPVTPKANRRVIDSEVVDEGTSSTSTSSANARRRAHNRSQQKSSQSSTTQSASGSKSSSVKKPSILTAPWVKKSALWGGSLVVVVAVLIYTRPDMDWQIEHINRLQSQVVQLHETNQRLVEKVEQQQQEMEARIEEVLNRPENQPLISQGDLDTLKADTQQQMNALYQQLQTELSGLAQQTESRWQTFSEQTQQALQPSDQDLQALSQLEQKVQSKLELVGEELSKLFAFKDQQIEQNVEQSKLLERAKPLNSFQIQQWMIEINNQWLLKGDAEQTQTQLLALEQALAISDVQNMTEVARTIGQDIRDIQRLSEQQQMVSMDMTKGLNALKALITAIPLPTMTSTKVEPTETNKSIEPPVEESQVELSSMDKLLNKFSDLVSLKKRETAEDLSAVEGLLLHDVLIQRLALLVDRVEWAVNIQSTAELKKAIEELNTFVAQNFAEHSNDFTEVLELMQSATFVKRQPLALVSMGGQ
ncbi:MAG: hypothetical protein U9R28_07280 [Pseudomonadota bacterium]|nr:hypothetical protein [Pseudomonadota bacterium]